MADIPTPRSYNQILGDMIAAFLARYPVNNLKVGGPILSMLEAAAQADLRNTSDIFKFLASVNLDSSEGFALDKILADEGTQRLGSTPSNGLVTVNDTRYTKLASTVYHATPAPLIGSTSITVPDALGWPASGSLYIGRGTENYEGPIVYTAITPSGSAYAITLLTPTTRFHNQGESVIVGQGGDRTISAGSIVNVALGNSVTPISFSVLYSNTLLDGEVTLEGVKVVCTNPGREGNVTANSISEFTSPPFTGATAYNPLPFTNGFDAETDAEARTRIRALRKARTKGTKSAIEAYLNGVTAQDESKRITSVRVLEREGLPATAYIDDGTGYEEISENVPYEVLTGSATGGEEYFQLSLGRPVAKASLTTLSTEPWNLGSAAFLAARVGGLFSEHEFNSTEFRNSSNAAAFEVAHSINSDSTIPFSARLSDSGRRVTIFAKDDQNEDIEVVAATGGTDANDLLAFPVGRVDTCKLFKNDVLLVKDGMAATIESNPQSTWQAITSGDTLDINVDGTGIVTYTFNDVDFVNAGTSFLSVNSGNSLESWAAVLNYKIPGITASVIGNQLQLISNAGAVARGSLAITGGDIVTQGAFPVASATARTRDYTLNRNTGQLRLASPLTAGDRLTVGSPYTNAFLESGLIASPITIAAPADMWFAVDGAAQLILLPLIYTTTIAESAQIIAGAPTHLVLTANQPIFADALVGDWAVLTDSTLDNNGAWRVAHKASDYIIQLAVGSPVAKLAHTLAENGLAIVRTTAPLQFVTLAAGDYTAEALATQFSLQLEGAYGEVVRPGYFRVASNSRQNGDIMYVIGELDTASVPLDRGVLATNQTSHNAFAESSSSQNDVPKFGEVSTITATASSTATMIQHTGATDSVDLITGLRSIIYPASLTGLSNPLNFSSAISFITGGPTYDTNLRETFSPSWLLADRAFVSRPFNIGPLDDLALIVDGDTNSKRFSIPLSRKVRGTASDYSTTGMTLADADNSDLPLSQAFGSTFSFNDFALYMRPRVLVDPVASNQILWRWKSFGHAADDLRFVYDYPRAPDEATTWEMASIKNSVGSNYNFFKVILPSGTEEFLTNVNQTMRVGILNQTASGTISSALLLSGLTITSYGVVDHTTYSTVTLLLGCNTGTITGHGLVPGDIIYANFTSGPLTPGLVTLTAATGLSVSYDVSPAITPTAPIPGSYGYIYRDSPGGQVLDFAGLTTGNLVNFSGTLFSDPYHAALNTSAALTNGIVGGTNNTVVTIYFNETAPVAVPSVVKWSLPVGAGMTFYPSTGTVASVGGVVDDTWPVESNTALATLGFALNTATWYTTTQTNYSPYVFSEGFNSIRTTTPATSPSNYTFDLKDAVTPVANRDYFFDSEDMYLVPMTTKNLADYLNSPASGGFSQSGIASASARGNKLQISSKESGSPGSIEIQGGLANSATATIVGQATLVSSTTCSVVVPNEELTGLNAGWWYEIQNTLGDLKATTLSTATLTSIVGNTWTFAGAITNYTIAGTINWQFERMGRYMAASWEGINTSPTMTFLPGDFVVFAAGTASPANLGVFTIAYIDSTKKIVWFENANGVEERATAVTTFAVRDSVMPGDTVNVGTSAWGTANQKSFIVDSVTYGATLVFTTTETPAPVGAPVAGPQPLATVRSGVPLKVIKKLRNVFPYSANADQSVLLFSADSSQYTKISSSYGSKVVSLSKLGFLVGTEVGKDGYAYNTGLIGEANRVVYGLESDPTTYPGVVASGANVNISGPVVRRITVSLGLRLRNGANKQATFDAVRSSVSTYVNGLGVGIPVAISAIINSASAVGGVEAVSVSSPSYSTSADQISVQPYEKPLVLSPDLDITLTLIG